MLKPTSIIVVLGALAAECSDGQASADRQAWQFFIQANAAAPLQMLVQVNGQLTPTNNALWETWADDSATFPSKPALASPPQWPATATGKLLRIPPDLRVFSSTVSASTTAPPDSPIRQEIRRNRASFDFIVSQQLWYREGLAAAYASGTPVSFPSNATEIKADWAPISTADKPRYHWNYTSDGQLYGLVAMHIMTKRLPNWTWATFEHVDNLGRCDYLGCHDDFGCVPKDIPSQAMPPPSCNDAPSTNVYEAGRLTTALLDMMASAGLGPEWRNYRLKGTQTDFVASGKPSLLGNSVTEAKFVGTASCITCHSQASVDLDGGADPTLGFTPDGCSTRGTRQPGWFVNQNTTPASRFFPVDFEWGVIYAQPLQSNGD